MVGGLIARADRLRRPRELAFVAVDRVALALGADNVVSEGSSDQPAVALSFDDGPSPHNTPELLDLLFEHDARATLFVVGESIPGQEAILERAVSLGHEIGNHTYSHPHTAYLRTSEIAEEVARTNEAIASVGATARLVRPPFGKDRWRMTRVARRLGMDVALWSLDSGDTRASSAAEIAAGVIGRVGGGAIVLFHDGGERRPRTLEACAEILPALTALGLRAVTITDLVGGGGAAVSSRADPASATER
jgi:peptidoglycan/xylan/chitin deacetylase (PgdA/CDA1 family)